MQVGLGVGGRASRRPAVPFHRGRPVRLERPVGAPDPSDPKAVKRWVASRSRPTAVDVFAGAGGLSLGLETAGFDVLVGADSDPHAVESHVGNLGGLGYCGDLTDPREFLATLEGWGIRRVDLLAGGVPCQPFSRAGASRLKELTASGLRQTDDPRVHLWKSFVQIAEILRPRMVIVENVPELPRWNDGAVLAGFYASLRSLGYRVDARILDGSRFGVPQHRARMFLIARNDDARLGWPTADDHDFVSLRDAIGDLPPVPPGQREHRTPYRARPGRRSRFAHAMREGLPAEETGVVTDHVTRAVRPDDHEAFCLLGEGQTYADLPARLQRYRSDIFTDKYKRLEWAVVSRTITAHIAKDGYWYIHPEQHRTLSVREAARVQTFPDRFRFAGTQTHRFRQIGNAVPPRLGEIVGRAMLDPAHAEDGRDDADVEAFAEILLGSFAVDGVTPWRRPGVAAWHVLVGELYLRRTRGVAGRAAFRTVQARLPTPTAALDVAGYAEAGLPASLIRDLPGLASALVERHDGEVPEDLDALGALPGVGDGVALSVWCFGFGRPAVLFDSTVSRVVSRLRGSSGRRWQLRLDVHALAGDGGPGPAFNAALHELADSHCRPTAPLCPTCPVRVVCRTGRDAAPAAQTALELEAVA